MDGECERRSEELQVQRLCRPRGKARWRVECARGAGMTLAVVEAIAVDINRFSDFSGALSEKVILADVDRLFFRSVRDQEFRYLIKDRAGHSLPV